MATSSLTTAPPSGEALQSVRGKLTLMLLAAAVLMVAWSFAVPVFEGPDEPAHWQYAYYLNQTHTLPILRPGFEEADSPPLYYLLISPLAVNQDSPPIGYEPEGYYYGQKLLFPPRLFKNASGDFGRYWPFRAARLASVLISVLTVWFCALAGMEASGGPLTGLLVGGLVAFWPMFTFRGMNVTCDVLLAMFSALSLYLMVRLIRRGFTWGLGMLAALAVAAAFLSKTSAVVLPGPLLLVILTEKAPWRAKLARTAVLGAVMLAIVSPWLIRNLHLYGDIFGEKGMLAAWSVSIQRHSLTSSYFRGPFPAYFIKSFIGFFGWLSLRLPMWVYLLYTFAFLSAAASWLAGVWRRRIDFRLSAILALAIVLNLFVVVHINLTYPQAQGRYMFPTVPAIALLLGLGLDSLRSWSTFRTRLTLAGLALANMIILAAWVIPAYWPPVIK